MAGISTQSLSQSGARDATPMLGRQLKHPAWPMVVSAVVAALSFAVTLGVSYMIFDDINVVQLDPRVHSLTHLKEIWTQSYAPNSLDNLWRPLTSTSYAMQWQLTGDRPWMFHLVNILLHAGVAAAVARLGQKLANNRVGLFAGVLFAIHPVHVEAVAAIVGRAELMCALCGLCAIVLALQRPLKMQTAIAAAMLCIASAYCKEQGLVLPLVLIPLLWQRSRTEKSVQVLLILITLATTGTFLLRQYPMGLRFDWDRQFLEFSLQPLARVTGRDRWLIPVACVGHYMTVMLLILRPAADYGSAYIRPPQHLNDPFLWLGAAVLLGWAALAVCAAVRRNGPVLLCLLGLAILYGPVSNFYMLTGDIMAERLFYFPSVFLLMLLAMLLDRLNARVLLILLLIITPLSLLRTISYARLWNDPVRWAHVELADRPESAWLAEAAAHFDRQAGNFTQARAIMKRACAASPESARAWQEAGMVEFDAGDYAKALIDFDKTLAIQVDGQTMALRDECVSRIDAKRRPSPAVQ